MTVEIKTCRNRDTYETCEFIVIGGNCKIEG